MRRAAAAARVVPVTASSGVRRRVAQHAKDALFAYVSSADHAEALSELERRWDAPLAIIHGHREASVHEPLEAARKESCGGGGGGGSGSGGGGEGEPGGDAAVLSAAPFRSASALFEPRAFFSFLRTESLGHVLLHTPVIGSTQTLMAQHAIGACPGVALVADRQVSGLGSCPPAPPAARPSLSLSSPCVPAGRGGNTWTSPAGCLMVSFRFHIATSRVLPCVQHTVGVALTQAVRSVVGGEVRGAGAAAHAAAQPPARPLASSPPPPCVSSGPTTCTPAS